MSERYVPPPPPYELSLQRDQKVAEEVQALEVSKERPFQGEEHKDSKALAAETLRDIAIESPLNIPKRPTRQDSAGLRAARPLPPSPANFDTRPLVPRQKGSKFRPVVEVKTDAAQNNHEAEPQSPAPPPFSAIEHSLGEPPYMQDMLHPTTSVHPSPLHYPAQSSYNTPRRNYDNRWSAYEPYPETSFRRSSHAHSPSTSYLLPQNRNFERRLPFDPSVAYSNSQASPQSALSAQRGVAASLYSSAVSSHLHLDSAGSRQSYVGPANKDTSSVRPTLRNTETSHLDKTDVSSVRSYPPGPMYPSPSTSSLYTPGRPTSSGGYEQRWATSESDIARDVYRR